MPNASEESSAWMLRFAQHDKKGKCASFSMTKPTVSFRAVVRNPVRCGCLASLRHDKTGECAPFSMTKPTVSFRAPARNPVRCGCFASLRHDQTDRVIPSVARNPVHGCFASFSMTRKGSFRALFCVISICILLNWFWANKTVISSASTETFFTEADDAIPRNHLTR